VTSKYTTSSLSADPTTLGTESINLATISSKLTTTYESVFSSTVQSTYTSFTTAADGDVLSSVITTQKVVATSSAVTAVLQGTGGSSSGGLSSSSKSIVGGVVGGVGGAILVGAIALLAWRRWGRKKRQQDVHNSWGSSLPEDNFPKEEQGTGAERYHNPNGGVNTASNF
jgi:hypothetical protein